MAIFSKGADPEALEASATRLDGQSAELGRIDESVRTSLSLLVTSWVGGDAEAAALTGRQVERAVAAAGERLRSTSEILRRQARQQRAASAGGAPGGSAAPVRHGAGATAPAPMNLVGGPMLPDGGPAPHRPGPTAALTTAQVAAFTAAVGHPPLTANDATTAAMLDPTTQQAKYQGVAAVVKTFPITPRPGGGVVRVNLFIPGETVYNINSLNLGDGRDFDPNAAPDASRVTLYVDYDNGIVVARQNPSVSEGVTDTGLGPQSVVVGTPDITVAQFGNGVVAIGYDGSDPFAAPMTSSLGWSVNGRVVIDPGANGAPVSVSGERGNYPSLEAYATSPAGDTSTLYQYRATGSEFGPVTALHFHESYGTPPAAPPAPPVASIPLTPPSPVAPGPATTPTVVPGVVPTPTPTAPVTPTAPAP